ncbi:hypothetical protein L6452_00466 [Arctium lappa]|uniref:Uncharacterized protein n=1 Tax=Arctium lappa TaxID=4217 RepID=A0ACB9FDY2_ARCLA|nr:hypothetical protein L6452_00466 [Arctium lappa]
MESSTVGFKFFIILVLFLSTMSLRQFGSSAQFLPDEEVETLGLIASKLKYTGWNVATDSCTTGRGLNHTISLNNHGLISIGSNVTCNCNSTVCHVTTIQLKGLNMTGVLPEEFVDLTFLQEIDLTHNYINGTIPSRFGQLPLRILTLMGNRITGSIPREIGDISTLEELVLEDNLLGGPLHPNLGRLTRLRRFFLSGNNFTGIIPVSFGNLVNIEDFRIDGNTLSGRIPDFIGNWTRLNALRISDLAGSSRMRFPDLHEMKKIHRLTLRNCLLTGPIPDYIGEMSDIKNLDLSFNRLNGSIPNTIQALKFDTMFLNNNALSGEIPEWISVRGKTMILVSALSSSAATNTTFFKGNEYEEDSTDERSYFYSTSEIWAYSTNGVFTANDHAPYIATTTNVTGGDIYRTARLSPTSLRYYGLCLRKGSYKVTLHFAEISYSDDMTFSSLGRRYFDVSIQGVLIRKDFNIMEAAKGVRRGTVIKSDNVIVNGSTLEIHLYWAGKGTTSIPYRGVYGPLISAISIEPNYDVSPGLAAGAIVGIVIGCCAVIVLILAVLWRKGYLGGDKEDKQLRALQLQTCYFSLQQIKSATHNFDSANKIGEGGFGPVYKGVLTNGSEIAVKQLSAKSKQGNREFVTEIGMISALQHPNLVKLYGCCVEGKELLLVYEYLENNSLARALFGREDQKLNLDWPTRKKICMGIARGLAYLHEESRLKIVHRDIKATNVLLDRDLNAKISDFGLAKLDEEENTHISTRIAGTMPKEEFVYLLDWAYVLEEQGSLLELVDPGLGPKYPKEEAMMMLNLALLCTNPSPTLRPPMSLVVKMLEGKIPVQAPMVKQGAGNPDIRFKAFDTVSQDSQTLVSTVSTDSDLGPRSLLDDGPRVDVSPYRDHESSEKEASSRSL